jgi:hypothetical protein
MLIWKEVIVLFAFLWLAQACTSPSATSAINHPGIDSGAPILNAQGTGFISNPTSKGANDSRLLQLSLIWDTVDNRTILYSGVGPVNNCSDLMTSDGWVFKPDDGSCGSRLTAKYLW